MSPNDKPWMTPKLKMLINSRYDAFRSKQFPKFIHLKEKVKKEIQKAKRAWLAELQKKPQGM